MVFGMGGSVCVFGWEGSGCAGCGCGAVACMAGCESGSAARGLYERNRRSPWLRGSASRRLEQRGVPEAHVADCAAAEGVEGDGLPRGARLVAECERGGVWLGVCGGDRVEDRLRKVLPRRLGLHSEAGSPRGRADPEQLRRSALAAEGGRGLPWSGFWKRPVVIVER